MAYDILSQLDGLTVRRFDKLPLWFDAPFKSKTHNRLR
ncbi:hypothetical protein Dxin01_02312 [Deinococcus xinjiangensis]|uniref:Transposase n=1 Tax=Deinococcus xinjiangensis TaxID=457454 RepID=A0ABP9VGU4_9DEIO